MRQWAFARISLRITDAEFFGYTPAQLEALTEVWAEERQWDLASRTASALNSKWSHAKQIVPFSPRDFIPKSAEERRVEAKAKALSKAANDRLLELKFAATAAALPKKGASDGARPK